MSVDNRAIILEELERIVNRAPPVIAQGNALPAVNADVPVDIVAETPNNINYLRRRAKFELSEDAKIRLNTILNNRKYTPDNWDQWFDSIMISLNDSYGLGSIIESDLTKREMDPVRYTGESQSDWEERTNIFLERKHKMFVILMGYLLSDNVTDGNAREVANTPMVNKDPNILLQKLKTATRGSRMFDVDRLLSEFGRFCQYNDDDRDYIKKARQLFHQFETLEVRMTNADKMCKVAVGLHGRHEPLKTALAQLSDREFESLTLDDLLNKMIISSKARQQHGENIPGAHAVKVEKLWGTQTKEEIEKFWNEDKRKERHYPFKRRSSRDRERERRYPSKDRGDKRDNVDKYKPQHARHGNSTGAFQKRGGHSDQLVCKYCDTRGHQQHECSHYLRDRDQFKKSRGNGSDPTGITKT